MGWKDKPAYWKEEPASEAQLKYIQYIQEASDIPLPEFTGKTKGEAAEWIDENRYWAYHTALDYNER